MAEGVDGIELTPVKRSRIPDSSPLAPEDGTVEHITETVVNNNGSRRSLVIALKVTLVIGALVGLATVGACVFGGAGMFATSSAAAMLPAGFLVKLSALVSLFPSKLAFVGTCFAVGAVVGLVAVGAGFGAKAAVQAIHYHRTHSD